MLAYYVDLNAANEKSPGSCRRFPGP